MRRPRAGQKIAGRADSRPPQADPAPKDGRAADANRAAQPWSACHDKVQCWNYGSRHSNGRRRLRRVARPSTCGRKFRAERIHLAATLLNNAANPHDSSLTSPYFFLCSGRRLRHIKDTRSCRRQIARPRSAMVWLPRSAKIERDDRAGHGTICHLNNLD